MNYYGSKELAGAFRTVRNNTIQIAEEIPEDKYSFQPAPGTRTVAQTLVHISHLSDFPYEFHGKKLTTLAGFDFLGFLAPREADEKASHSKAAILKKLADTRDQFASWLEGVSDDFLGEVITLPPGGQPASRTRFDMLMSVKEHEMHHRGQLMLVQRMLGLVPHLTRQLQERRALLEQAQKAGR